MIEKTILRLFGENERWQVLGLRIPTLYGAATFYAPGCAAGRSFSGLRLLPAYLPMVLLAAFFLIFRVRIVLAAS